MKVSKLTGAQLAEWVARANGWKVEREGNGLICWDDRGGVHSFGKYGYRPDLSLAQGGPIIERERIDTSFGNEPGTWEAFVRPRYRYESFDGSDGAGYGPSLLIAAMRAYVASKFGDEVPDIQ